MRNAGKYKRLNTNLFAVDTEEQEQKSFRAYYATHTCKAKLPKVKISQQSQFFGQCFGIVANWTSFFPATMQHKATEN